MATPPPPPPTNKSQSRVPPPVDTVATAKAPVLSLPEKGFLPPRLIVNAVEKWGKTSLLASASDSAVLMARGETGYTTLFKAGLVPARLNVLLDTWDETLAMLDGLIADQQELKVIGLDAMSGFERLCQEKVCARDFKNDWGEREFAGFQRGYDLTATEWLKLLQRLDILHQKGLTILLLSHSLVKSYKNPDGPDYDRHVPDCHYKVWGLTHKWVDAILFGNFLTILKEEKNKKAKGIGKQQRVLYAQNCDSHVAGSRYNMSEIIDMGSDPLQMWNIVCDEMKIFKGDPK